MNNHAIVLQEQGKWQEAEKMHGEVLEATKRRVLQEEYYGTLSSMNNLATVLREQGKWQEAEKMHGEVLEKRRRGLGEDHYGTLSSMNNLATVLREQGKWQEAEKMHGEVLEKRRRGLGEDHYGTLSSMNNLATVLREQGKWQEAEKMHGEVLEKRRRGLGEDHYGTLSSMNNLATVLREQGKWQEAEKMHGEVLEKRRRGLGEDHYGTLSSMNNLATVLREQGKWQEAEKMHGEVLEKRRRGLGEDHYGTLSSMNNLATAFQELGNWHEAEKMYREVLEIRRGVLGEDHKDTLSNMNNLATVLREQGKWQEAEKMYGEVLEKRRRVLGEDHYGTLSSMANLAIVLRRQGKWQEAEKMHREGLEAAKRRILGEDHQHNLRSMLNLGSRVSSRDRHDWQFLCSMRQEDHRDRLKDSVKHLGEAADCLQPRTDHPDLLEWRVVLVQQLLIQTNDRRLLQEVQELLHLVVSACSGTYGVKHPHTLKALGHLIIVLEELGTEEDADLWRHHYHYADSTMVPSTDDQLEESRSMDDIEGLDEKLRAIRDSNRKMASAVLAFSKSSESERAPHQEAHDSQDALFAAMSQPSSSLRSFLARELASEEEEEDKLVLQESPIAFSVACVQWQAMPSSLDLVDLPREDACHGVSRRGTVNRVPNATDETDKVQIDRCFPSPRAGRKVFLLERVVWSLHCSSVAVRMASVAGVPRTGLTCSEIRRMRGLECLEPACSTSAKGSSGREKLYNKIHFQGQHARSLSTSSTTETNHSSSPRSSTSEWDLAPEHPNRWNRARASTSVPGSGALASETCSKSDISSPDLAKENSSEEMDGSSRIELQEVDLLILNCQKSLADLLQGQGKLQEAEKWYREILEGETLSSQQRMRNGSVQAMVANEERAEVNGSQPQRQRASPPASASSNLADSPRSLLSLLEEVATSRRLAPNPENRAKLLAEWEELQKREATPAIHDEPQTSDPGSPSMFQLDKDSWDKIRAICYIACAQIPGGLAAGELVVQSMPPEIRTN
eukprot:Skav211260  [mRNA]  locus=scaffold3676:179345:186222:+ [translate_table: standard]